MVRAADTACQLALTPVSPLFARCRANRAEEYRAAEHRLAGELQKAQEAAEAKQAELRVQLDQQQRLRAAADESARSQGDETAKLRQVRRAVLTGHISTGHRLSCRGFAAGVQDTLPIRRIPEQAWLQGHRAGPAAHPAKRAWEPD